MSARQQGVPQAPRSQFVATRNSKRTGKMHLRPVGAVVAGVAFGRPCQSPFAPR